jgi:hypothetical protein
VGVVACIEVGGVWSDGNSTGIVGTGQMQVLIIGPDLSISRSDVLMPDRDYHVGERIPITVRINNTGDIGTNNISLRFLVDGKQYGETHVIETLAPGQSWFVFEDLKATAGNHMVSIEVDHEDSIDEYNETDNAVSIPIYVDERPFYWEYALYLSIGLCIVVIVIWHMFGKKDGKK